MLVNNNAEVCAGFREFHQCCLDLAGEDDQAPDGDCIVAAPLDGLDLWMSSSTGAAVLPPRAGEVAAAVANHGRAVSCEPRPYQFAIFPFFKPLPRLWIDAFYEEGISPCM